MPDEKKNITVTMTKEQWAGVIRLMREGDLEGAWFVGKDKEVAALRAAVCALSGITDEEADAMEPVRDPYPRGDDNNA